jgi:hypothetical protein
LTEDPSDEVTACVDDSDQAAAVEEVAPDFACEETESPDCRYRCVSFSAEVDEEEYGQICAITVLPDPPDEVVCWVFLGSTDHRQADLRVRRSGSFSPPTGSRCAGRSSRLVSRTDEEGPR